MAARIGHGFLELPFSGDARCIATIQFQAATGHERTGLESVGVDRREPYHAVTNGRESRLVNTLQMVILRNPRPGRHPFVVQRVRRLSPTTYKP